MSSAAPASKRIKTEEDATSSSTSNSSAVVVRVAAAAAAAVTKQDDETVIKEEEAVSSNLNCNHQAAMDSENVTTEVNQEEIAPDVPSSSSSLMTRHHFHENCPHRSDTSSSTCESAFCENCICYVCNVNPSQCSNWRFSHCYATQNSSEYWENKRQDSLERQAWLENPTIDLYGKDYAYSEEEKERARKSYFFYKNKSEFELAVKSYNLSSTQVKSISGYECPYAKFEYVRKKVHNSHHKKPCACCAKSFLVGMHYFIDQCANPFSGVDKYCLGCMGRIVAFHVSPDPQQLSQKLAQEKVRIDELWKVCKEKAQKQRSGR